MDVPQNPVHLQYDKEPSIMSNQKLTVTGTSGRSRHPVRIRRDNSDATRLFMAAAGSAFTMTREQAIAVANRIADLLEDDQGAA